MMFIVTISALALGWLARDLCDGWLKRKDDEAPRAPVPMPPFVGAIRNSDVTREDIDAANKRAFHLRNLGGKL